MKDGIIVINKPQEMTSFDVVAIMRKKLGIKRIGHLGTLDPMATGVLPVAIGKATRVMDYLGADMKEYIAEITFGLKSDTDDIWGEVTAVNDPVFEKALLEEALKSFRGVIWQVPPMYAAIKKNGRKLYEYARSGQEVEVEPRRIYIETLELMSLDEKPGEGPEGAQSSHPVAVLKIRCSKGTYIRSIARDLGDKLGCGAVMSGLIRTASGAFKLGDAIDLKSESQMEFEDGIFPIDYALMMFPKVVLNDWEAKLFSTGVKLRSDQWSCEDEAREPFPLDEAPGKLYRVYDKSNLFIGVGTIIESGEFKADKIFI